MPRSIHCLDCFSFSLSQRRAKLVVADTDWPERCALEHALEARGYTVFTAKSARAAAELIETQKPELAVLDLGLEDLCEPGTLEALRRLSRSCELVALSALGDPAAPGRLCALGARSFVLRPVDLPAFEAFIDEKVGLRMSSPRPAGELPEPPDPGPGGRLAAEPKSSRD